MKAALSGTALMLIMALAAATDGLVEEYGIRVWLAVAAAVLAAAGVMVWLSETPERRGRHGADKDR